MLENSTAYALHKLVAELDRGADKLLRTHLGLSYKRALFLLVLEHHGTVTQHELANALGYSDPAVSTMLLELAKLGYISTAASPEHGRKRLVTITPQGSAIVAKGRHLLDTQFDELMLRAGVNTQHYRELTNQIHQTLVNAMRQERQDL